MSDNTAPEEASASSGPTGADNSGTGGAGEIQTGSCNVCNSSCKQRCTACFNVYYCSKEHQKEDWKQHKTQCWPLVKAEDETFGRYWVASRNIKVGEIILQEKPAILVPRTTKDEVVCVVCAKALTSSSRNSCTKCGWPVCGSDCEKASAHAENECPVFATRARPFPPPGISTNSAYLGLGILRVLLTKTRDPELWNSIIDLQQEISKVDHESEPFWIDRFELSQDLAAARQALNENVAPELASNDEEWGKAFRILKLNGFGVGCDLHPPQYGLFLRGSFLTHSCAPNAECMKPDGDDPETCYNISVRATTDIKKGQMVTTSHILSDADILNGTDSRLLKSRQAGFWCKCPRCLDPTELGTYASAIMCTHCPEGQGIMLPRTFYDLDEPNRCQTPGCQHTMPRTRGDHTFDLVGHVFREIKEDPAIQNNANLYGAFIARTSGKILHPNNTIIVQISIEWLKLHRRSEGAHDLSDFAGGAFPEILAHSRRVADYMNKIERGLTWRRAHYLYIAADILYYHLDLPKLKQYMHLSEEQELAEWTKVQEWASVALNYYRMDNAHRPDSKKQWGTCISRLKFLEKNSIRKVERLENGDYGSDSDGDFGAQEWDSD